MDFLILNKMSAQIYECDEPHIYISITDPESNFVKLKDNKNRIKTLRLKFDDIDNVSDNVSRKRYTLFFNIDHAEKILDFVDKYKDQINLIICQCDGGISRSSATAAALSVIYNGSKSDNWIFDAYIPNRLVYKTLLDVNYNYHINKEK